MPRLSSNCYCGRPVIDRSSHAHSTRDVSSSHPTSLISRSCMCCEDMWPTATCRPHAPNRRSRITATFESTDTPISHSCCESGSCEGTAPPTTLHTLPWQRPLPPRLSPATGAWRRHQATEPGSSVFIAERKDYLLKHPRHTRLLLRTETLPCTLTASFS